MESAKTFSLQANNQLYLNQETILTNHPISQHPGIQINPVSDFHMRPNSSDLFYHMDDNQRHPSFSLSGNQPITSHSCNSNTPKADDPETQYNFPLYQLSTTTNIQNQQDPQEDLSNTYLLHNFDGNPDTLIDDQSYLNDACDFGSEFSANSAGFSSSRPGVSESLPIDIQSSGLRQQHHGPYFHTAPASDLRGGSCSNFGSTSSTPGGASVYQQQQEMIHSNSSNPRLSFDNRSHRLEERYSVNSVHSAVQATEDVNLSSIDKLSLDDRLSTSNQPLLCDVTNELLDDVVFEELPDSQADSNLLSFDIQTMGPTINVRCNHPSPSAPLCYPPNAQSFPNVNSSHMIELCSLSTDDQGSAQEPNYLRLLSEKQRADQRRVKNNLACKKARQKRKKIKLETEALVNHLTQENSQLKEKILALESDVEKFKAVFPNPHSFVATTDLTYFQQ